MQSVYDCIRCHPNRLPVDREIRYVFGIRWCNNNSNIRRTASRAVSLTRSTSGSSYLNVALSSVHHLHNVYRRIALMSSAIMPLRQSSTSACSRRYLPARSRYVTVRCQSVCPSVCLSRRSTASATCSWFAAELGLIDNYWRRARTCCPLTCAAGDRAADSVV